MQSIFFRRAGAFLLDILVLFAVLYPLGLLVLQLIGVRAETPQGVYGSLLLNFSLPVWAYFTWADSSRKGSTLGKRMVGLHVRDGAGEQVTLGRAFGRTAVKMIPWETAHASSFLLTPEFGEFGLASWIGLAVSYVLIFVYLMVAWRTKGRRSVHDMVAATKVERTDSGQAGD